MFLNLIKYLFKLNKVKVGDIIIAKRYDNIIEKYKIKKGHRIGPFIVIYKKGKKLYALSCTSNNKNSNAYIKLNSTYNFNKETYLNLKDYKIIKNKHFIKIIDKLSKNDLNKVIKKCKQFNKKQNII